MEIFIAILLMIIGILFLLLEIFIVPGFSVSGVVGMLFVAASVAYSFVVFDPIVGAGMLLFGLVVLGVGIWLFIRSCMIDKMSLKAKIQGRIDPLKELNIRKGDRGVALSRMAPVGTIEIDGNRLEAISLNGLIDEKSSIEVVDVNEHKIIVKSI